MLFLRPGLHDESGSGSLTSEPDLDNNNTGETILISKEKLESLSHLQNTVNRLQLPGSQPGSQLPSSQPGSQPGSHATPYYSQPSSPATTSPPAIRSQNPLSCGSSRFLRPRSFELTGGTSPKNSPINFAKSLFRFSGSHLKNSLSPHTSPRSSPRQSPLFGRKKFTEDYNRDSEFVHWWMDDATPSEVGHWSQVLEKEGEWVYFWHTIRYKLKAI